MPVRWLESKHVFQAFYRRHGRIGRAPRPHALRMQTGLMGLLAALGCASPATEKTSDTAVGDGGTTEASHDSDGGKADPPQTDGSGSSGVAATAGETRDDSATLGLTNTALTTTSGGAGETQSTGGTSITSTSGIAEETASLSTEGEMESTTEMESNGAPMCPSPERLADAGDCTGRLVGVALAANRLSETPYALAAREFNYVTAENEMKWSNNEPSQGQFNFSAGDQIANFAAQNGMQIKGHALVWHNQLPPWVENLNSEQAVRSAMVHHIQQVMEHYRGSIRAWDVVNEAWNDDGTSLRDSVFHRYLGPGFIDEAFIAAREADPDAKLYYNDFDAEDLSVKSDAVYEMVRGMVERGVPIDGVGLQMHVRIPDDEPSIEELRQNMQRIVDLGLDVLVSEIDVRLCNGETEAQQAARYHDIIEVCLEQPGCTEVTVWGITDRYSWLNSPGAPGCPEGETSYPLLWDGNYQKKPAYQAVMDALLGL